MKVLIFDLETGGLNYKVHSPLEVGACVMNLDSGELLETFSALFKFDSYVCDKQALDVNGLDPNVCQTEGIEPQAIGDRLLDMWVKHGCSLHGGHNVAFDERFLAHHVFKIEPESMDSIFSHRKLDSFPVIALMLGNNNAPAGGSLKQAIKHFGIKMDDIKGNFHGALYDAVAAARLLHKFRTILKTTE